MWALLLQFACHTAFSEKGGRARYATRQKLCSWSAAIPPVIRVPVFVVPNWRQTLCLDFVVQGGNVNRAQHSFLLLTTDSK